MEKKTRKKKKEPQLLLFLLLGLAVVALLVLLVGTKLLPQKDYFEVEERASRVPDSSITFENYEYGAVGWVRVQGTNIDYPILYDEDSYETGYPVQKDHFAWLSNYESKFNQHMIISGHNVFNLSEQPLLKHELFTRFEELLGFIYYDFAKENEYIQLTFDGKEYVYKIFAVALVPTEKAASFPLTVGFSENDAQSYIDEIEKLNLYKYKVDVNKKDNLITLITCTRIHGEEGSYEFRVVGRMVREGERINKYPVEKTKAYSDIEKLLKGDDKDDEEV